MPVDSFRVTAPFNTTDYRVYSKKQNELPKTVQKERHDGRQSNEHRPIVMKIGILSQAKGSAYVEYQNTKVICSVFDPREIPNKSEYSVNGGLYCEFKFASFSTQKRRGFIRDAEEREYSVHLRRALEPAVMRHQFSNFQVDIYVLVLENDGSCLAAAISCANLALANACVPMHDLVTAVSLGLFGEHEIIDPTYSEERSCLSKPYVNQAEQGQGIITVSYMKIFQQITEIVHCGIMHSSSINHYIEKLIAENEKIYNLCRQCLVGNILVHLREKKETEAA